MAVVTISREFGSEGNVIGIRAAEALGYRFVFKQEIGKVFEQYGFSTFEQMYETQTGFWTRFDTMMTKTMTFLNEVIRAFAAQGDMVIVGRCSCAILQGLADVLHVRVQAPLGVKVGRILKENITGPGSVEALVQAEDRNRAKLLQEFYDFQWDLTGGFDVVIDTGKVLPEMAVEWIVDAVKQSEATKSFPEPNTKSITVNPVLHNVVTEMLSM